MLAALVVITEEDHRTEWNCPLRCNAVHSGRNSWLFETTCCLLLENVFYRYEDRGRTVLLKLR
jgi:hypothetical protein